MKGWSHFMSALRILVMGYGVVITIYIGSSHVLYILLGLALMLTVTRMDKFGEDLYRNKTHSHKKTNKKKNKRKSIVKTTWIK